MSKKRKKGVLVLITLLLIVIILILISTFWFGKNEMKIVDEISKYGYTLDERDTQLMKDIFNKLKSELDKKEINFEKYAEYLSELFIIDLYTLDNKVNKYDVGGVEYIHPNHVQNYQLKVGDTLYRYLEDSSSRKAKMPQVSEIALIDILPTRYTYLEKEYEAFSVKLRWDYVEDLGYDETGTVIVMNIEGKLYVSEYSTEVEE
ncbi:MAG: hypothetical protein E7164_02555 [Firmicutes bacterium]|nr:hypothetical protein [Bacillota bacterium]